MLHLFDFQGEAGPLQRHIEETPYGGIGAHLRQAGAIEVGGGILPLCAQLQEKVIHVGGGQALVVFAQSEQRAA